jgi:hypothetical protein
MSLHAQSTIQISGTTFNYKEVPAYNIYDQPDIGIRLGACPILS